MKAIKSYQDYKVTQTGRPEVYKLVDIQCNFPLQVGMQPLPTPTPEAAANGRTDLAANQTSPGVDLGVWSILEMYFSTNLKSGNKIVCTFVNEKEIPDEPDEPDEPDLPSTGFSTSRSQALPVQPDGLDYADTGLTIDIPILDVSAPLVTVPLR